VDEPLSEVFEHERQPSTTSLAAAEQDTLGEKEHEAQSSTTYIAAAEPDTLTEAARGTELAVERFLAEVRENQSEKLIVRQEIVQIENPIHILLGRSPEPVERNSANFFVTMHALSVGVPSELIHNRPDVRRAERELAAAGLNVKVARACFLPLRTITEGVSYEAFNPRHLFITPEASLYNVAGGLVGPPVNFNAIQADYLTANARQLQSIYNYQRVIINAFAEVINRMSMVETNRHKIEIKQQQVQSLEEAVVAASTVFQNPRGESPIDYIDVLRAQRDLSLKRATARPFTPMLATPPPHLGEQRVILEAGELVGTSSQGFALHVVRTRLEGSF
jgi:outer membrane protein, multidrug efflux system